MTTAISAPAGVTIRSIAQRDLESVVRLDALHTGEPKPAYWKQVFRDFLKKQPERVRVGLIAEQQGALAGFVLAEVRGFEFGSEPCGWVLEIGVDPTLARRQIATELLAEASRRLRASGITTVRTMVRRNDVPVLTFFRTNGFAGGPYVQLELTLGPDE
jgi:ribosomal protein S18 acetylase RimI-like enzyme